MSTYRYIAQRTNQAPIRQLCHVLGVAPAAYYAWHRRQQMSMAEPAWQVAVREAFTQHSQRYGTRRLRAQQPRSFVPRTTDSDPTVRAAPNRLLGQPAPPSRTGCGSATSRVYPAKAAAGFTWPSGSTAARAKLSTGTCALAMPEDLVSEALRRALVVRRPAAGLVVHSDQASQYTVTLFKDLLARYGATQSTSRRGNCYDNAHAESFWSRFKAELLDGGCFPGLEEAKLEISHHIASYNAERRHPALGYLAPNHFQTHLKPRSTSVRLSWTTSCFAGSWGEG